MAGDGNLITARDVKRRFGDISDMSLWRWLQDEELGFPKPIVISRRRYWKSTDIDSFIARREALSQH